MIVVRCPSCNAKLEAHRTKADGTVDCPRCGQPMTLPTAVNEAETMATPRRDPERTLTVGGGTTVSEPGVGPVAVPGFEVIEEIGRGGMGIVYKARQLNPPRLVALKMILAGEHADPDQLARFRTEAEATARLAHPAIVQIHQVGEWHPPSGGPSVPFLTLEFVEGRPLSERLKSKKKIAFAHAADFVRRLARGVHFAHKQGIVHRDLKPSNVLLSGETKDGGLGEPKIVDFGLAKTLDGFGSIASEGPQTQSGAVLGTPSYMAPEQAAGRKTIGPAADVYALGAILYELLTGRPPFAGETTVETLLAVAKDDPEPPRRLRPKLPRDLETICLTCLAKKPEQRYPSAAALAKDLGRFLDDEPIAVRPAGSGERLGRWLRRRKELVILSVAAVAAVVAVVAIIMMNRPKTDDTAKTDPGPEKGTKTDPSPAPPNPPPSNIEDSRRRVLSINNLKQLGLGMHNFHDINGYLPPAAIIDRSGKPLLSWRVLMLPYIEQQNLFKQFRLDEPWDSAHNKQFIDMMPPQFTVDRSGSGITKTHYQAVVGPGTIFEIGPKQQFVEPFGRRGRRFTDITDGTSNTLMLVEAAEPVIWTKPDDVIYDGKTLPKLGGVIPGGFTGAMADGSVLFVRDTAKPDDLRYALTCQDGMVMSQDWNDPPGAGSSADVTGRVSFNGEPLPGGIVTFEHQSGLGTSRIGLFIQTDGTYRGSRLAPGKYRVAVSYVEPNPPTGRQINVPKKYADVNSSGLAVELVPGRNTFDLELK